MTDSLQGDVRKAKAPAERLALSILASLGDQDPVESLCALSIAASHCVAMVASEGILNRETIERVQPDAQRRLLEIVLELCRESRTKIAN